MALKDKLMTLEDFKAVRDVDVASNQAQFTAIKADLNDVEKTISNLDGISEDVKLALLNCFANVAWNEGDGTPYYNALHDALYANDGLLYDWDFSEGLTDRKQGATIELTTGGSVLPTLESDGIHYTDAQQYIIPLSSKTFPMSYFLGKTIQVDVKSFGAAVTTGNIGFITHKHSTDGWTIGLVYRNSSGGWSFYNGTTWASSIYSGMAGRTDISGKRISLYYDASGYAKLYVDGVFKGASSVPLLTGNLGGLMIGNNRSASTGGIFYPAVITGLRIYDREVA